MNLRRSNINFDHILNFVRKDERQFILLTLINYKDQKIIEGENEDVSVIQEIIQLIKDTVHVPYTTPNKEDGTSTKTIA